MCEGAVAWWKFIVRFGEWLIINTRVPVAAWRARARICHVFILRSRIEAVEIREATDSFFPRGIQRHAVSAHQQKVYTPGPSHLYRTSMKSVDSLGEWTHGPQ